MWAIAIKFLPDITNEPQLSVRVVLHAAEHFARCPRFLYPSEIKSSAKLCKLCDFLYRSDAVAAIVRWTLLSRGTTVLGGSATKAAAQLSRSSGVLQKRLLIHTMEWWERNSSV